MNKNFIKEEFIGLYVEVIDSKNKDYIGIFGKIVDETKNTFKIDTEDGIKTVIKEFCTFLFYKEGYVIKLNGKLIKKRPWERIKEKVIKW